jgi:hypothetical protein
MAIVTTDTNLTGVSYAQAETIEIRNGATLTVSATPATRPGTIQCITSGKLRIENSSTTVPLIFDLHDMDHDLRFEAGGVLEIRGAPMSLGTGTGSAQTWDFTSLFGGVIRHMNYVEVEESAGSGVFMPWQVVHEDPKFNLNVGALVTIGGATPAAFTAGNAVAGRALFWHETNRTLRTGDGTNGAVVPSGCAVRIPNIYVSNRLLSNSTRVASIITSGVPTGGTFQLEIRSENNATLIGTTANIAFNATAATIDAAIEAVTGAGTMTAAGGPLPAQVSLTWAGSYVNIRPCLRIVNAALTGGTNPQAYVIENATSNMSLIDLAPLGTMDCEWVSFSEKFRVIVDTFKSVRLVNVGFGGEALQLNSSNGGVVLDGVSTCRSPFIISAVAQIASVFGPVSVKRVLSGAKNPVGFNINIAPGLTEVDRVTTGFYGTKNSNNNRTLQVLTVPAGLKLTNLVNIGAPGALANLTGCTIAGHSFADSTLNTQQSALTLSAWLPVNCVDCTFAGYSGAGPAAPRGYVMQPDAACSNIKVLGAVADGANNTASPLLMQCGGLEIANVSLANVRGGPFIDLPSNYLANNLIAKKVFGTFATAQIAAGLDACQGGQYDMVSSTIAGITETFSGVNDFVGGNYTDPSLTPTTGHVTFGPFGAGVGLELTGAAYTDALGAFLLPEAGDTAVITMPFAMHGITGFQSVNPYLYVDAPGAAANQHIIVAPGVPTGGTYTLSFYDASGTLIGTTVPLGHSATATSTSAAITTVLGTGNFTVSNSAITTGVTITGAGTLAGQAFIVSVNGSALTGGTEPGVAYAYGRARLLTGTETLGSITTAEFAMRVPGTAWPAYAALTGANLASAFAALTGYAAGGTGLEMRLRITAGQTNPYTKLNQISLPTNVDPSLWVVGDATIELEGPNPTDVIRVIRASDNTVLYSFTGGGVKEFTVGANFDVPCYFRREDSGGTVLMRTLPATQRLNFGNNGIVSLFYGAQVQLAQASTLAALDALIQARLDVAVSTREAESAAAARAVTAQAEHDATQTAIAAIPAAPDATAIQAAAAAAIAAAEPIAADVRYVKGIEVVGTGVEADPWGPAA